jgi:Tfp pilus assembly protein PilX
MIVRTDQRGLVSLFTTIMISLLLVVITISMISVEAIQLRKTEDAEQSSRAYYAAEAGVEDAVSKVLSGLTTDQACVANLTFDTPGNAGWTCQQISFSGSPFGKLPKADEAVTIDPQGAPPYQSIIVQWNQSSSAAAGAYTMNVAGGLPSKAQYLGAGYVAPPLELQIVEYPAAGNISADEVCVRNAAGVITDPTCKVKLQNVVLVPGGTAAGGAVNYNSIFGNATNFMANCGGPLPRTTPDGRSSDYNCYAILSGFSVANNYLFRLRSRYQPTSYRMSFYNNLNGTDPSVDVPDGTATIDVTARAGQTFRRVISKLPRNQGAAGALNYVMFSDNNVCKNFDVIDNVAQSGCPYLP